MFTNCPHCRRLLALDANGKPTSPCPHCHDGQRVPPETVSRLHPNPGQDNSAGAEPARPLPEPAPTRTQPEQMIAVDPAQLTASTPQTKTRTGTTPSSTSRPATQGPRSIATLLGPAAPSTPDRPPAGSPARHPSAAGSGSNSQHVPAPPGPPPAAHARSRPATASAAAPMTPDAPSRTATPGPPSQASGTGARPSAPPLRPGAATPPAAASPATGKGRTRHSSGPRAPSFARQSAQPDAQDIRRHRLMLAGAVGLAGLLIVQLVLAQRAQLAQRATWRPVLTTLCSVARCSLPPWHEPEAFVVVERDIRGVAAQPGVLQVTARIRNDARWAQAWPQLQLTLSDTDGTPLATRVFQPEEYLGGRPEQATLDAGADGAIQMRVREPGPQAIAFTFDFH